MSHAWPIDTTDLVGYIGMAPSSGEDEAYAAQAVAAAVDYVNTYVLGLKPDDVVPVAVGDMRALGATMLAGRLYARRSAVLGVASYGELGVTLIVRSDPDIRLLLGSRPAVG